MADIRDMTGVNNELQQQRLQKLPLNWRLHV